jgi:hypothetical protein
VLQDLLEHVEQELDDVVSWLLAPPMPKEEKSF